MPFAGKLDLASMWDDGAPEITEEARLAANATIEHLAVSPAEAAELRLMVGIDAPLTPADEAASIAIDPAAEELRLRRALGYIPRIIRKTIDGRTQGTALCVRCGHPRQTNLPVPATLCGDCKGTLTSEEKKKW